MNQKIILVLMISLILFVSGCTRNQQNEEPESLCGNEICELDENNANCYEDCGINPPPYNVEKYDTLEFQGIERTYMVHVPSCYNENTPIPLVMNFHGGGGTGEAAEIGIGGLNNKANRECFIAIHPNGVSSIGIPGKRQHWNSGTERTDIRNPGIDDISFISLMLDAIEQEYNIDADRVYATGISNGAQISYRLACELSERISAIAPVGAAMLVSECNPENTVSVMHIHGTSDPGWPYYGGPGCFTGDTFEPVEASIQKWVELNNCANSTETTFEDGDTVCEKYSCQDSDVILCTIQNGGHTWPGPNAYVFPTEDLLPWDEDCYLGSGRGMGEQNKEFSAINEIWDFFENHPKMN